MECLNMFKEQFELPWRHFVYKKTSGASRMHQENNKLDDSKLAPCTNWMGAGNCQQPVARKDFPCLPKYCTFSTGIALGFGVVGVLGVL